MSNGLDRDTTNSMNGGIDAAATLAAIDRCWNIEWRENPARLDSTMALVCEYLRRSTIVAEAVGDTLNWPWFDAAARLTLPDVDQRRLPAYVFLDKVPQDRGTEPDPLEDKVRTLQKHFNTIPAGPDQFPPDYYGRHSCWWYIRWASIRNHPALAPLNLPDLYEPLIVLYERGGSFHPHHGFIEIFSHVTIPRSTPAYWVTQEPLPSLGWAALDQIDREDAMRKRKAL